MSFSPPLSSIVVCDSFPSRKRVFQPSSNNEFEAEGSHLLHGVGHHVSIAWLLPKVALVKLDEYLVCGRSVIGASPLVNNIKLGAFDVDFEDGQMAVLHASHHAAHCQNRNLHYCTELRFIGVRHDGVTVMIAVGKLQSEVAVVGAQADAVKMKFCGGCVTSEKVKGGGCGVPSMVLGIIQGYHVLIPLDVPSDTDGVDQASLYAPERRETELPAAGGGAESDGLAACEDSVSHEETAQAQTRDDVDDGELGGDEEEDHESGEEGRAGEAQATAPGMSEEGLRRWGRGRE